MQCLFKGRLLKSAPRLFRLYSDSTPNPQEQQQRELVQRLISQAEEYRQELRNHIYGSPQSRKLKREVGRLEQTAGIIEERRKQLADLLNMTQKPDIISLEILSNGTTHLRPSVFVRTPFKTYLFNCPEGTSRFMTTMRVRPQTIHDFFITRGTWDCMGGLFGVLLGKDSPDHTTLLHGPPRLKFFLESVRPFADSDFGGDQIQNFRLEERSYDKGIFEDVAVKVSYIPLFTMNSDASAAPVDAVKSIDVSYLLELTEPNRRIDILKLSAKKVPKGPLVGKLKAGESITLDDGTIIRPEDVFADYAKDHAPSLLIVDCDDVDKLESLSTNSCLQPYTTRQKQMGYVVHMTPEPILTSPKYQEWLETFGPACLHIIANGSGEAMPLSDGIYRQQHMLNEVCPELFPPIYPADFHGKLMQEIRPPPESGNVILARPLDKFPMRTTNASRANEAIIISLNEPELKERTLEYTSLPGAIEEFRQKVQSADTSGSPYPALVFLGTGSAVPSKYRNVSSYWLQMNAKVSFLIDCGEGAYGQLKVFNGPDKITDALIGISAVFITHAHLDHIGGLNTLIMRRLEAFRERGLEYRPLILACNQNVRKLITLYRTNFQNLEQYIERVDIGLYVKNAEEFYTFDEGELVSEITRKIPKELFSADEWNLKSAYAVQVHHTRMANGFVFNTMDGKRLVFSGDTMPCKLLAKWGKNADLLVHEATFEDGHEVDARKKKHSTTGQALDIGQQMNAKLIMLTHFSARYPRIPVISDDMLALGKVGVAFDNMILPFNMHSIIPYTLPFFRRLFNKELDELAIKEMQRNLRVTLEEKVEVKKDEKQTALEQGAQKMRRSRSPVFKKPRRKEDAESISTGSSN